MAKKDIITRRRLRLMARRIIKKVEAKENFRVVKKIKFGSRFYVAKGRQGKTKALYKTCLYPRWYDHLTNQKFSREIIFLNFIQRSPYKYIIKSTPKIFSSQTGARVWYIREYLDGKKQNINNGNVRFKPSFFNQKSMDWSLELLKELHSITSAELPYSFRKLLYCPQSINYMWQFISPYLKEIERFTGLPQAGRLAKKFFTEHNQVYKKAPRVIAHQEFYSPHVLDVDGQYKLIDWENVGWAPLTKDAVTIWMRTSKNPAWQKNFFKRFKRQHHYFKKIGELWTVTVLLQSVFNVIGYHFYPDKKDFHELALFSSKKVREILSNNFNPLN